MMLCKDNVPRLAFLLILGLIPTSVCFAAGARPRHGAAKPAARARAVRSYTCTCDSPCSGSKKCETGCYAICEKNAGRNVCVLGCSSESMADTSEAKATGTMAGETANKRFGRFSVNMPASRVAVLMASLFNVQLATADSSMADKRIRVRLRNVGRDGILKALAAQGLALKK